MIQARSKKTWVSYNKLLWYVIVDDAQQSFALV